MKGILIDENLPASLRLPTMLPVFAAAAMSDSPSDTEIWDHAKEHGLVVVTKDADFSHRILLGSAPPWIVHVRLGNLRLRSLLQHLVSVWPSVESQLPACKLISIFTDRIEMIE
jgi:predicted nuclease of predicted toxin-antitoxin system